ncbi:MAG: helix-turn-helix domain-containing protein [Nitriliruptoraceae bacterium]|nr:helix-turn-helix domain-containing protein [Nitriliruptoraceae bacterium]
MAQSPEQLELARRAAAHHALADVHRLAIVDALQLSDATPTELGLATGLHSNLLTFHLDVLEDAGLIERVRSEGDGRRRYVRLCPTALPSLVRSAPIVADDVLFVCTANSARSQLAAALWTRRTGRPARSAGASPADQVHPLAVEVARAVGLDLAGARPQPYGSVDPIPDLVVSVCDRANEAGLPFEVPTLHWSIPDPVGHGREAVEAARAQLEARIDWLASCRVGAA